MSCFNDKFRKARIDFSPYLFHFIKGEDSKPCETLSKILAERQLTSRKNDYICFSASPVTAIKKFFEVKVNRTGAPMYQPWGIAFSRDLLVRDFKARNVIYTDGTEDISSNLCWRTMELDVDRYDYEYLSEWRIQGNKFDFSSFPNEHILVITPKRDDLNSLIADFDMEFTPYFDYCSGNVIEDWSEEWSRGWKGIAVDEIGECLDDYAISSLALKQKIGEDMLFDLLSVSPIKVSVPK